VTAPRQPPPASASCQRSTRRARPGPRGASLLPVSHAFVEALFLVLPRLRREDPALARPLRRAAVAVTHALVASW
jgi:hypothetical protein